LLFLNTKQAVANDATTTTTTTTTSARAHVASNRKHERVQGPHRRRSNRVGRLATFLKFRGIIIMMIPPPRGHHPYYLRTRHRSNFSVSCKIYSF
jgi:hypothetical protein